MNEPVLPQRISMNSEAALERQLAIYREMTGEQRLLIALGLHELSCQIAREGIRGQFPTATAEDIERLLRQRLELARER